MTFGSPSPDVKVGTSSAALKTWAGATGGGHRERARRHGESNDIVRGVGLNCARRATGRGQDGGAARGGVDCALESKAPPKATSLPGLRPKSISGIDRRRNGEFDRRDASLVTGESAVDHWMRTTAVAVSVDG